MWIQDKGVVWMRPNPEDSIAFEKFFFYLAKRQEKSEETIYPIVTLDVPARERTYKQNNTLWALIRIIFESMNGRKPTKDEAYELYLDILAEYAERVPSRFSGALRPIHISESDTRHAAQLIQACFDIIVDYCDLTVDLQADVRKLFYAWHDWRGKQDFDPLDCADNDREIAEREWREKHKISDASGVGGVIEKAHIVSRGANVAAIDKPWNWLALTPEEHRLQHQHGWGEFLAQYPHLRGRVERARKLAAEMEK
jgi:hypothetical protein